MPPLPFSLRVTWHAPQAASPEVVSEAVSPAILKVRWHVCGQGDTRRPPGSVQGGADSKPLDLGDHCRLPTRAASALLCPLLPPRPRGAPTRRPADWRCLERGGRRCRTRGVRTKTKPLGDRGSRPPPVPPRAATPVRTSPGPRMHGCRCAGRPVGRARGRCAVGAWPLPPVYCKALTERPRSPNPAGTGTGTPVPGPGCVAALCVLRAPGVRRRGGCRTGRGTKGATAASVPQAPLGGSGQLGRSPLPCRPAGDTPPGVIFTPSSG